MESFRHICQRDNVAIVMVTHDSGMARYCHTVYTLEDGVFV